MGEYKTPGVYIKEKNAFGNSVVEAETAIPAFIGYTEKAENGNDVLENIPWKISSMTEFVKYFGGAPELKFDVDIANNQLTISGGSVYTLYYNMVLFFANGGSTCYVVSVGKYSKENPQINPNNLIAGIKPLELVREITMVVIPEAANIQDNSQYKNIQTEMLKHCGGTMKNRFSLLDIYPKEKDTTTIDEQVNVFWDGVGSSYLSYGAAYFPWLNTSVLSERDLNGEMFSWSDNACTQIEKFTDPALVEIVKAFCWKSEELEIKASDTKGIERSGHTFKFEEVKEGEIYADADAEKDDKKTLGKIEKVEEIKGDDETVTSKKIKIAWNPSFSNVTDKQVFHQALSISSVLYKQAIKSVLTKLNLLPPSAAMAGIYTMVDRSRGVWKAPANVTLNYVNSVTEDIDDDAQANLNAPMNGKAVNVIRPFRGEGIKVWGARTLDGNSLDWRYVNVRRTLLFLEESVRNAARAYVFEPNDAGTWINMKCMIENFLRSVWKRGGLAGATPEDAFEVHIGLGDTMTGDDILDGIMRITVLVAVTHPAEFIEITFQQQMQKS